MEYEDPILVKMKERLEKLMKSPEMLKWADILARQGVWVDSLLQPGGPGILQEQPSITVESPLKERIVSLVKEWGENYDSAFLKANRIKVS